MSIDKTQSDRWTANSVTSFFRIAVVDGAPACVGQGSLHTPVCGLGWRFQIDAQANRVTPHLNKFIIKVTFDPHHIGRIAYESLTIESDCPFFEHPEEDSAPPIVTSIFSQQPWRSLRPGCILYALPNTTHAPLGTMILLGPLAQDIELELRVILPSEMGLEFPSTQPPVMQNTLRRTITGGELIDLKFRLLSRRMGSGAPSHPKSLYASSSLLKGWSDDLDLLIQPTGFREAMKVDLDANTHEMKFSALDCDYDADSDLASDDSDPEEDEHVATETGHGDLATKASEVEAEPSSPQSSTRMSVESPSGVGSALPQLTEPSSHSARHMARMGQVIDLHDVAYKTWKVFLSYCYGMPMTFAPLKSQHRKAPDEWSCSPKSMYRVAHRFGLPDLMQRALDFIKSCLNEDNIVEELFITFTARYPEVQVMEVSVFRKHIQSDMVTKAFNRKLDEFALGHLPLGVDMLKAIFKDLRSTQVLPFGFHNFNSKPPSPTPPSPSFPAREPEPVVPAAPSTFHGGRRRGHR